MLIRFGIHPPQAVVAKKEQLERRMDKNSTTAAGLLRINRTSEFESIRMLTKDALEQVKDAMAEDNSRLKRIRFWWG